MKQEDGFFLSRLLEPKMHSIKTDGNSHSPRMYVTPLLGTNKVVAYPSANHAQCS